MLIHEEKRAATISRAIAAISCAHALAGHDGFGHSRKVKDALKEMRRIITMVLFRSRYARMD